ncbi:hypothetical protein B0H10DRAFT_2221950 [Mycena sp. CBHHK59/15]|nr:hypothetical protein B0H10DRAFT_2221950 [Mycena sp. CBHHK59/15]
MRPPGRCWTWTCKVASEAGGIVGRGGLEYARIAGRGQVELQVDNSRPTRRRACESPVLRLARHAVCGSGDPTRIRPDSRHRRYYADAVDRDVRERSPVSLCTALPPAAALLPAARILTRRTARWRWSAECGVRGGMRSGLRSNERGSNAARAGMRAGRWRRTFSVSGRLATAFAGGIGGAQASGSSPHTMESIPTLRRLANIITDAVNTMERVYGKVGMPLPSLDEPFHPQDPAETLRQDTEVSAAVKNLMAAAAQISATVCDPMAVAVNTSHAFHVSSCLLAASELNVVEILREAGPKVGSL